MKTYVNVLQNDATARRLSVVLKAIIASPRLHARMLNTLARLEYVGVRKMLKSRHAGSLDLEGVQHIVDESIHVLRLKKAAVALDAPGSASVATFADADTLAGDEAERYFQEVDRAAERVLAALPESDRPERNYLLTSAVIEIRAQAFYPLYEAELRAAASPVSVAPIMRDEDRHLEEMQSALAAKLPGWKERLEAVLDPEGALFAAFLDALERATVAPAARA